MFHYRIEVVYKLAPGPHVYQWTASRLSPLNTAGFNRLLKVARTSYPGADTYSIEPIETSEYNRLKGA